MNNNIILNPHIIDSKNSKYIKKEQLFTFDHFNNNNISTFKEEYLLLNDTTLYFGQLKLLISEIQFLAYINSLNYNFSSKSLIIYIGSAPGNHISCLIKLFPKEIKYFFIDIRRHHSSLINLEIKNEYDINIITKWVDDDFIKEFKNKYIDFDIIFICDIRDAENIKNINNDMKLQLNWYNILNPIYSLLKFRFNFVELNIENNDDLYYNYLDGLIFHQAYKKKFSSESRLFVKQNAKMVKYNMLKYEQQMVYYNLYTRKNCIIHDIDFFGIDQCVDCNIYIEIIKLYYQYSNIYKFKNIIEILKFIYNQMKLKNKFIEVKYNNKTYKILYKDYKYGFNFDNFINKIKNKQKDK